MSGFLYYVVGRKTMTLKALDAQGLGYIAAEAGPEWAATAQGPDGAAGVIFSLPGRMGAALSPSAVGECRWEKYPGREDVWLGWNPKAPPAPIDLVRSTVVPGHPVKLSDGNEWLVPVARRLAGRTELPCSVAWDGKTWKQGQVLERYRELWEEACRLWDEITGAKAATIRLETSLDFAARALAVNYRLGPAEISALQLFDTESEGRMVLAVVDWPAFEELEKKVPGSPPAGGERSGAGGSAS
jgi:hypothetical protein